MQQVHQQQLLVVLLVCQPQSQQCCGFGRQARLQQRAHVRIDVPPVGQNLADHRTGEQPALRPRLARPECLVIGIEQVAKAWIELVVARQLCTYVPY